MGRQPSVARLSRDLAGKTFDFGGKLERTSGSSLRRGRSLEKGGRGLRTRNQAIMDRRSEKSGPYQRQSGESGWCLTGIFSEPVLADARSARIRGLVRSFSILLTSRNSVLFQLLLARCRGHRFVGRRCLDPDSAIFVTLRRGYSSASPCSPSLVAVEGSAQFLWSVGQDWHFLLLSESPHLRLSDFLPCCCP